MAVRALNVQQKIMNCPNCDAIIYSRRSGLCGVCGKPLPAECLFTESQKAMIEDQLKNMEKNHQAAQAHMDQLTKHARGYGI